MSEAVDFATLGVGIGILAFLWNPHRDFATLQRDFAACANGSRGLRVRSTC